MNETNNIIEVRSLVKRYDDLTAVDHISFSVRAGEVIAFLGPNGAGKSTTVEILECLKTPTSGSVTVLGYDIGKDELSIKKRIGVLPQEFSAFTYLTVYENMDYFAQKYPKHVDIEKLIIELGLKDKRDTLYKNLSGGLKQRVGIALALVNDPDIVFLDEPSTGLDPRARRDVWDTIKQLKSQGKTILLTTHYMDEAHYLADRVCIIHKGKIIAEGAPEDLINTHGGGNTLIIRDCAAITKDRLTDAFPQSKTIGNDVLAKIPEGDGMESISRAISIIGASSLSCREVYIKKSSLEDVFLNLTGQQLVEGAD